MKKHAATMTRLTTKLFNDSLEEVLGIDSDDIDQRINFNIKLFSNHFSLSEKAEAQEQKRKVDDLYLEKLIQLSTNDLNRILELHMQGRPARAERTLEAITNELTRRSLLDDSSQSDTTELNEEMDVKTKAKRTRKQTPTKGNKARKSR